jgi:hypothetical protein
MLYWSFVERQLLCNYLFKSHYSSFYRVFCTHLSLSPTVWIKETRVDLLCKYDVEVYFTNLIQLGNHNPSTTYEIKNSLWAKKLSLLLTWKGRSECLWLGKLCGLLGLYFFSKSKRVTSWCYSFCLLSYCCFSPYSLKSFNLETRINMNNYLFAVSTLPG